MLLTNTGRKKAGFFLGCGFLLAMAGCATVEKPKLIELMWPEPPLTPRIKFVRTLASEEDLQRKTTFGETLIEFLTGKRPPLSHLYRPMDIAVSNDGKRVYVSDFGQASIYLFDLTQQKVTRLGSLTSPFGIALDAQERLYVVEQEAKSLKVLDRRGEVVKSMAISETERPTDIAIDQERGLIYVADSSIQASRNHFVKVYDLAGKFLRNIGKGRGTADGFLHFPTYVTLDKDGNLYVTETLNSRVSVFDPEGNFVKKFGERGTSFGMFDKPKGVALDAFGNVYVADSGWSNVQIFNQKGQVLLFFGGRGDYPGLLKNPTGIAIDKNNTIYVADLLNYRVSVYQLVNTEAEDSFAEIPKKTKGGASGQAPSKTAEKEKKKGGENMKKKDDKG